MPDEPRAYIIYLISRGYAYPEPRVVGNLTAALWASGRWSVSDRVSGESLGTLDNATTSSVEIAVECGCFRILEIRGDEGAVTWQLNHGNRVHVVTP